MPTTNQKTKSRPKRTTKKKTTTKNKVTYVSGYSSSAIYLNNSLIYSDANSEVYDVLSELADDLNFVFEDKSLDDYNEGNEDFPDTLDELGRKSIFDDAKELDNDLRNKAPSIDGYSLGNWYHCLGIGENEFIVYATHKKSGYLQTLLKEGFKGRKVVYRYSVKKVS